MERGIWGLIFLLSLPIYSQTIELTDSVKLGITQPDYFEADAFGNIYWIQDSQEIVKWEKITDEFLHFATRAVLSNLDVQNSFQISMQSNTFDLLVLDNNLNPIQDFIPSPPQSRFNPTLLQLIDNQWLCVFDPVFSQLVIWDYRKGEEIRRSRMIYQNAGAEHFKELLYKDDKLYLVGEERVLEFNYFLVLREEIVIEKNDKWLPLDSNHIYLKDNKLHFSEELNPVWKTDKPETIDNFSLVGNKLFVLSGEWVYIYNFKL